MLNVYFNKLYLFMCYTKFFIYIFIFITKWKCLQNTNIIKISITTNIVYKLIHRMIQYLTYIFCLIFIFTSNKCDRLRHSASIYERTVIRCR